MEKRHTTLWMLKPFYLGSLGENRKIWPIEEQEYLFPFAPVLIPMGAVRFVDTFDEDMKN